MRRLFEVIGVLVGLCFLAVTARAEYYYSSGQQVPLSVDTGRVAIKFDPEAVFLHVRSSFPRLGAIEQDINMVDGFLSVTVEAGGDIHEFVDSLNDSEGILAAEPYYHYASTGLPMPVGDRIVAGFDTLLSDLEVTQIVSTFNLDIVYEMEEMSNVFVLRNSDPQSSRLLDAANQLYVQEGVEFSHPIFGVYPTRLGYKLYDHYSAYQNHLKRIIGQFNTAMTWDFAGVDDSVVVAVIDDGVVPHEDLPSARILPGRDYASDTLSIPYDNYPYPGPYQAHGMACAGLIAASHTTDSIAGLQSNSGVFSMNPRVKILPVKIFKYNDAGVTPEKNAAAIAYARISGASILSNSWGYGPGTPLQGFDVINRAINDAYVIGRGGLGCVILFAAGNDNIDFVTYPANKTNVLSVGAITTSDQRWAYSNYGSELDVVAPSGDLCLQGNLWSLDQMASSGYNPNVTYCDDDVTWNCSAQNDVDYDCHFGGTSGACPIVAGAASLVLAKQPNLLASEVYNIIRQSSDTTLNWGTVPRFSSEYGYGCVDAFTAVLSLSHGDVNNDGYIADLSDLSLLIAYLTTTPKPQIFPSTKLADWNCSNTVDMTDLALCIAWVQGLPTKQPPVRPCFKY